MNPEILTAFAAGVASTAATGGLVAAWTANRLISKRRQEAASPAFSSMIDEATGLYNWEGFTAAVEDLAVTAAAANQTNRLLLIKSNGLEEVEDTFGPYAASLARDAFVEGLRRLAGPSGVTGSFASEHLFGLLTDERTVETIAEHGLGVEVLLVAEPDFGDDVDPALHRSGDDYFCISGPGEDAECDLEVYDRIHCEATAAWRWFEPDDDVHDELRLLKKARWVDFDR